MKLYQGSVGLDAVSSPNDGNIRLTPSICDKESEKASNYRDICVHLDY